MPGGAGVQAFAADFHGFGTVKGGAGADSFTVQGDANFAGTLDGQGGSDAYTVNLGASLGAIAIADSGAAGSDCADGQQPDGGRHADRGRRAWSPRRSFPGGTVTYSGIDAAPATHTPSAFAAFIQSAANTYLGNHTKNLPTIPPADLDGFLAFGGGHLDVSGATGTSGVANAGNVSIHVSSATLFPGTPFSAAITPGPAVGDTDAIDGTYNLNTKIFTLHVHQFSLNAGGAFTATANTFTITYDPSGPANATLITVAQVQVAFPALAFAAGTTFTSIT